MRIPPIQTGQTAGIVTPARKVDEKLLRNGAAVIETWGLQVKFGKHCFSNDNQYLAATDTARLADLQMMLDDPEVNIIFCARGGYGTGRIIDQLNFEQFIKRPKWIVGFSDITALHLRLHQLNVQSIHGPMPAQYSKPEYQSSVEFLQHFLFNGGETTVEALPGSYNRNGESSGVTIGGNLSLIIDSLGTPTEVDGHGKILIVEEVDEQLYKVDRMFNQLKRSGTLAELAGLVIGHMTDLKDTELPFGQSVEELIMDKVSSYAYPVGFNFPIGHDTPNYAWIHSGAATLRVTTNRSELVFH